jgi:hypothetical protein
MQRQLLWIWKLNLGRILYYRGHQVNFMFSGVNWDVEFSVRRDFQHKIRHIIFVGALFGQLF